jgi:hypothetical protein
VKYVDDSVVATIAASCKALSSIHLGSCNIGDQSLRSLAGMGAGTLSDLNIRGCTVSEEAMVALIVACRSSLRCLNVEGCEILSLNVLSALETLDRLESIKGEVTGDDSAAQGMTLLAVAKLVDAHSASLILLQVTTSCYIEDKATVARLLAAISACTKLRTVDFRFIMSKDDCYKQDQDVAAICKTVTQLHDLRFIYGITWDKTLVKALAANCPNMEHLLLPVHADQETVQLACSVTGAFPNLKRVVLPCKFGILGAYHELFSTAKQLTELIFRGVETNALAEVLPIVSQTINPGLELLELNCQNGSIGDFAICCASGESTLATELQALASLVARCSESLRIVTIHKGSKIGPAQVSALATCGRLEELSTASGGEGITRANFRALVRGCPRLGTVDISYGRDEAPDGGAAVYRCSGCYRYHCHPVCRQCGVQQTADDAHDL